MVLQAGWSGICLTVLQLTALLLWEDGWITVSQISGLDEVVPYPGLPGNSLFFKFSKSHRFLFYSSLLFPFISILIQIPWLDPAGVFPLGLREGACLFRGVEGPRGASGMGTCMRSSHNTGDAATCPDGGTAQGDDLSAGEWREVRAFPLDCVEC